MVPVKWWNFSPTSSAASRKSGMDKGLAKAAVPGIPICRARPKDSSCRKLRRPRMRLCSSLGERRTRFFSFTVGFSALRECEDRAQCWQPIRTDRVPQHHRGLGGCNARHSVGRPNGRKPRRARTCIEECLHPPVRGFFAALEFLARTSQGSPTRVQVEVCLAVVRFVLHSSLVLGHGFQQSALPLQEEPKVVVGARVKGVDLDGFLKAFSAC